MKITLVPSAHGARGYDTFAFLTTFLIDGRVAFDAGCIGLYQDPIAQAGIKHIIISHSHIDHLASLPIFLENAYDAECDCVTIYGSQHVLDALQSDVFNNRLWPDMIALSRVTAPFLKLQLIEERKPLIVEGLHITPIPVNHVVPTLGFIIDDGQSAVVIPSDTAPTEEIWTVANQQANLKAVFLEATFPSHQTALAAIAKHLTPAQFAVEVKKITRPVQIVAVHIKPRFYTQVVQELHSQTIANLVIGQIGKTYEF